jgi:molybdate transport system substrate-binding protein
MRFCSVPLLAWTAACGSERPVTLFAASSLKEVVTEVAQDWSRRAGRGIRLRFEATSTLARQIREGAPADLFVSAAPEWMDHAAPSDRFDWLGNRLVLAVRRDFEGPSDPPRMTSLALANEQVPAGRYARAALTKLGIPLPARTIYGANVRDVLSKVSTGAVDGAVVYATDVSVDPDLRIAFEFPADSHPRIVYSVGLLSAEGRELFEALREPSSIEIAKMKGFVPLR